jgi:hypothetical protein
MTTFINYISGVVNFISTPFGITQPESDNSTLASTTAFVQAYVLNLINIISPPTIIATVNFAKVRTSLLAGSITSAVNLIIKGSTIAIGKVGSTLTIMGNNVPISDTFPSAVVSFTPNGSRIQAGKFTMSSVQTYTYIFPQAFTSTTITIVAPTVNCITGITGLGGTSTDIKSSITTTTINWVSFGN